MAKQKKLSRQGVPHTEEEKARVLVLLEEGRTWREISAALNIGSSTLSRILAEKSVEVEAIRARLREERAKAWENPERVAIGEINGWLGLCARARKDIEEELQTPEGKRPKKSRINPTLLSVLATIPKIIQASKGVAAEATKARLLLTGQATERVAQMQSSGPDMTEDPEVLARQAIAANCVDKLPPTLRAYAQKLQKES